MNPTVAHLAFGKKITARLARVWPGARGRADDFTPLFDEAHASSVALAQTVNEIEARFLAVSTTVEATTNIGRELVQLGEELTALATGRDGGEFCFESTARHIWRSIEFVECSIRENEDLIARLTSTYEQLNLSLAAERELSRALAPLTFVQSLFRIESARLPLEVQTMFQALVSEIERVRLNVENEFREKFQLVRDIREILDRAIAQITLRAAGARKSVAELRLHLTQSMERMQAGHERNRERDARLATVSQTVARETGRVVMSLQFYDTFTQRLQHTQKILGEMQEKGTALPGDSTEASLALHFLHQSGRICGAQLAAMQAEFARSGETLRAGIEGIVRQMAALDEDCIALRDHDGIATGVDGAVQILIDSVADVRRLVVEAESFAMESHRNIEPISGKTTHFTQFISNLSFEIQIIGLNAEIQSTHVGHGTGLEVLSAQTSAISRETSAVSTRLAESLDELTAGLGGIVTDFEGIRERSVAFNRTLAVEAAADNAVLRDYRDSSLRVLRKIGELLPQLEAEIKIALDQADFVAIADEPLARLETAVGKIAAAAEATADRSGASVEATGLTDHFLKFYTMATEGEVHRKALGLPALASAEPAQVVGEIDLFDAAPAGPTAAVSSDVELFGFDEATPAPTAPLPTEAVDLWLEAPAPAAVQTSPATRETDGRSAA